MTAQAGLAKGRADRSARPFFIPPALATDPFEIQPNQRYDRMFELMDCHGEYVERPEEFRPATRLRL